MMTQRKWIAFAIAVVVAPFAYAAQEAGAKNAVLVVSQKFADAYKACNRADLSRVITDDFQFIHMDAKIEDRSTFLANMEMPCGLEIRADVMNVPLYCDTAIITGKRDYVTKTGTSGSLHYTEVLVRRHGEWTLASKHHTRTQQPPAVQ